MEHANVCPDGFPKSFPHSNDIILLFMKKGLGY